MRHYLHSASPPGTLPSGMRRGTAEGQLVAGTGTAERFAATDSCATLSTILIAAVTFGTDAYLHRASRTTVESIRFLACPHAPRAWHWTKLRATGIKARQPRLVRVRNGRPGFLPRNAPGLRLSGVCEENTAASPSDSDHQPKRNECAKSAVNDLDGHAASNLRIRRILNPTYRCPRNRSRSFR